jgi:hypothetical protein
MVFSVGTGACGESEEEVELPETAEVGVIELGRIGGRIYNEPERAREILEAAGLSPEQFEERVRAITNDPTLSDEYTRGFETVLRPRPPAPMAVARDSLTDSLLEGPPEGRREGLPVDSIGRPLPLRPQNRSEGAPQGRGESAPQSRGESAPQGRRESPPVGRRESLPIDSIGRPLPVPPEHR